MEKLSRYEFKYLINQKLSEVIQDEIKHFMINDDYSDSNNSYFVRSLYFDNKNNTCFYEKADGMRSRSKFRLRSYSKKFYLEKDKLFFLEEKGRIKERTFKRRIRLDYADYDLILNNQNVNYLIKKYDNLILKKYFYTCFRKFLRPTILVDYLRKPFISKNGLYFRLTFDSNIKSCKSDSLIDTQKFKWLDCKSGYVIMELKFERSIPMWFHRIIQNYNLTRMPISKFVLGTEVNKIAVDPSS